MITVSEATAGAGAGTRKRPCDGRAPVRPDGRAHGRPGPGGLTRLDERGPVTGAAAGPPVRAAVRGRRAPRRAPSPGRGGPVRPVERPGEVAGSPVPGPAGAPRGDGQVRRKAFHRVKDTPYRDTLYEEKFEDAWQELLDAVKESLGSEGADAE
ncbi:hypothetical protein ABID80_005824 [Streptomyces sp. PvP037]